MIKRLRSMRDERGVAMITVIFVAAALTTVAAASSFMAIQQLKASTDDWRGTRAVSYGEAGLQRFFNELKLGSYGIGSIIGAGCTTAPITLPQGLVGDGTYDVVLTVFNPNTNPQVPAWTGVPNTTTGPCAGRDFTNTKIPQLYAISSTGTAQTGTRTIRSVVSMSGSGLPVGIFVNTIDANGNPDFNNISIFSTGDIIGRDKINVSGIDLNYTLYDIYGPGWGAGSSTTQHAPAAVHALGAIYGKQSGGKRKPIHPPDPNCSVGRGPQGQSMWDSSGTGKEPISAACTPAWTFPVGWTGPAYPPSTKFDRTDYARVGGDRPSLPQLSDAEYAGLKATAQASGLYCNIPASGQATCTKNGLSHTGSITDITQLPNQFVAYYEYAPGSNGNLTWQNSVQPCPTKSATVVVRNGDVTLRGGGIMYGTVVAPEGAVDAAGNYVVYGSIIANSMRLRGTAGFALDTCSVNNSPSTTLNVTPGRWSEVDR